jgi:hypothetical protein
MAEPVAVMLVPTSGSAVTSPPAAPWWLAIKRLGVQIAPMLPLLVSALIDLYQSGQIQVPPAWAGVLTTLVLLWNAYAKLSKEQERQKAAAQLGDVGLPVGVALHPGTVRDALYTPATLPPPPKG